MERSRKRSRDEFTAEEMEAADVLLKLSHLNCSFVQWAVKRKRSVIDRDGISGTYQSKLSNKNLLMKLGSWAGGLPSSSKDMGVKNVYRRRMPKRKTHKELEEMENTLLSEKSRLKKEEEQLMKTYQELLEWNHHLKSQLAARLDESQEQKLISTPQSTSSDRVPNHSTGIFEDVSRIPLVFEAYQI